jgi:hypothetical protein
MDSFALILEDPAEWKRRSREKRYEVFMGFYDIP